MWKTLLAGLGGKFALYTFILHCLLCCVFQDWDPPPSRHLPSVVTTAFSAHVGPHMVYMGASPGWPFVAALYADPWAFFRGFYQCVRGVSFPWGSGTSPDVRYSGIFWYPVPRLNLCWVLPVLCSQVA